MAVTPLLIDNPALRRGVGIHLGGSGFPLEGCGEVGLADRLDYLPDQLSGMDLLLSLDRDRDTILIFVTHDPNTS